MNRKWNVFVKSIALIAFPVAPTSAADLGTAFTYQGSLENGTGPVTDTCDFRFGLWDAAAGGSQVGSSPQTVALVDVADGVFTVTLDFGAGAIDGAARWLAIEVQCTPDGAFVPLDSQRVALTPAPHALALPGVFPDTATGNVGVGTTTPMEALDVAGVIRSSSGGFEFPDGSLMSTAPGLSTQLPLAQIATLRWDLQQGDFVVGTFPVGNDPIFLAFDGANIWVTRRMNNTVTKLRASDGVNLGTFAVGTDPHAVAFDGANIWTANVSSNNVTKLRASDGAILGTFPVGNGPTGVGFDGANIWVANANSGNVTKLRASDGFNLGTFPVVGGSAFQVAFDGANVWVTVGFAVGNVTKLRASDGVNLGSFAVGNGPRGVAFDGSSIWVANAFSNNVTKLRASDGANLGTFPAGSVATGVTFDGANIWVTNVDSDDVTKLRASDGFNLGTFAAGNGPANMAFDGANIWVANNLSGDVTKIFVGDDVGPSQWQDVGSGIAYTNGNVGIGTANPVERLDVSGNLANVLVRADRPNTVAASGYKFSTAGTDDWGIFLASNTSDLYFSDLSGGAVRMVIGNTGNVGIGDITPDAALDVNAGSAVVAKFNRQGTVGSVVEFEDDGVVVGTISFDAGGTVTYGAFTGSHIAWTENKESIERGALVSLTGSNRRWHDLTNAEIVYGIAPSTSPNDPRCLGAYQGLLNPDEPFSADNPHQVMAVGNGDMWVVDAGRNIEPGQYLISSDVKGHAMLDDVERFAVGYVVARAGEGVDWAKVSETVDGRKHKRISVFFESFERGSAIGVGKIVEEQQKRIDELSRRLSDLEAVKGSAQ